MEKINSKLNINLSENGNLYLTVYAVYGKKLDTDSQLQKINMFTTEDKANEIAKFWREVMNYDIAFTIQEIVFIQ